MKTLKQKVNKVLEAALIVLMAVMVLNVLWQVFTRFVLRDPSTFTDELARYLLIWLGLLGASYVAGQKRHLAIDYVLQKFEGAPRRWFEIGIEVSVFCFALFAMVIGGIKLVSLTLYLRQVSAALQIELGYVYLVVPVSGLLIMFFSVENLLEVARQPAQTRQSS